MPDRVLFNRRTGRSALRIAGLDNDQNGLALAWPSICTNIDCGACRRNISKVEDFFVLPSIEKVADYDASLIASDQHSGIAFISSPVHSYAASERSTPPTSLDSRNSPTSSPPASMDSKPIDEPNRFPYEGVCTLHPPNEVKEFIEAINSLPAMIKPMLDIFTDRLELLAKRLEEQRAMILEASKAYAALYQRVDSKSAALTAELKEELTRTDARVNFILERSEASMASNRPSMDLASRSTGQFEESEKKSEDRVKVLEDEIRSLKASLAARTATETIKERLLVLEKKVNGSAMAQEGTGLQEMPVKKRRTEEPEEPSPPPKKVRSTPQGLSTRGKEPRTFPASRKCIAYFKTPTKALERLHQLKRNRAHGEESPGMRT